MTSPSPTVRRREVGARLRSLRLAAGMTVEDAASRMEVSAAKISRIETAARGVSVTDVRFLCALYEVPPDDRELLLALTRESRQRSWWQQYGLPDSVSTYIGLEEAAAAIHQYSTSLIPPLLQTPDYAYAVTRGMAPDEPEERIRQLVTARLQRQNLLHSARAPELWTVLDEAALHRQVGSVAVMRSQLQALAGRQSGRVTIQIIPAEAGAHPGMDSAFTILQLQEVQDVVFVEGLTGNFFLENGTDLTRFRRAFDQLRAIAISPKDSVDRITRVATELDG